MKLTPLNMVLAAVVAYVVYQYFTREHYMSPTDLGLAIGGLIFVLAVGGVMFSYATSGRV